MKKILSLFCLILLTSCAGSLASLNETWTLSKVLTMGYDSEETKTKAEVSNCCGYAENKTKDCQISSSNLVSSSIGYSNQLEFEILNEKGISIGSGESLSLDPPPPGYIYFYPISTTYTIVAGTAKVKSDDGKEVTYEYRFQTSCELNLLGGPTISPCGACENDAITSQPITTQDLSLLATEALIPTARETVFSEATSIPVENVAYASRNLGSGDFSFALVSDGNLPYDQTNLNAYHYRIFRIRREENPDGCGTSQYNSDYIWFSGSTSTSLTINGIEVGKLSTNTGSHGFLIQHTVNAGDVLCASGFSDYGFHIIVGPDVLYHYNSYCYRGNCN
jgi:hypothetical protein